MPNAQEKLLSEIRDSLQHMKYMSISTGYPRSLMPHHIEAIMDVLTPVIDDFFRNNTVQAGKVQWDDNI